MHKIEIRIKKKIQNYLWKIWKTATKTKQKQFGKKGDWRSEIEMLLFGISLIKQKYYDAHVQWIFEMVPLFSDRQTSTKLT